MALTATASPQSKIVITESLNLENPVVVSGSINRPNIFLSASPIGRISVSHASYKYSLIIVITLHVERSSWDY